MNAHLSGVAHSPQPLIFSSASQADDPQFTPEPVAGQPTKDDIDKLVRASNRAAFAAWVASVVAALAASAWLLDSLLGIQHLIRKGL